MNDHLLRHSTIHRKIDTLRRIVLLFSKLSSYIWFNKNKLLPIVIFNHFVAAIAVSQKLLKIYIGITLTKNIHTKLINYNKYNMERRSKRIPLRHQKAKTLAGVLLIAFGTVFLAERMGAAIPHWVISWKTGLIAIGIVTLYKHYWQKLWGFVLIITGGVFLLNDIIPGALDKQLLFPIMIILFGIVMIAKGTNLFQKKKYSSHDVMFEEVEDLSSDDFIQSSTYFGGVKKNVVSKTFKGGNFSTAFGGTEINLSKADIEKPITINSGTVFGELKLIVPVNWRIDSSVTCILGEVEDKRPASLQIEEEAIKIVHLTGTCLFGGVKIISY